MHRKNSTYNKSLVEVLLMSMFLVTLWYLDQ
jgi:hypothetical protein